jgi:predicted TIM-barrel fold metal-dependent hydrolase
MTDEELMRRTLDLMERYNMIGVVAGAPDRVGRWKAAAPDRVIPALGAAPADSIRKWAAAGAMEVMGELFFQVQGVAHTDSSVEPYFALAEELDLPVAIHVGPATPATPYVINPVYRVSLGNPLLLEDALVRHPDLRIYLMEGAWPMVDELVGLLYAYPQVYVEIGRLTWEITRREFHSYLRRLVDAGFGKRIMFGSDQIIWPDAISVAVEAVESADFLEPDQKRDIFYNNAARFFRLSEEEIARHHGREPAGAAR